MVVSSLIIPVLSRATKFSKVTANFSSIPVEKALKILSSAGAGELTAAPDIRNDLMFLRVSDADPARLRTAIATTLDGKWLQEGRSWVLHRDPKAERRRLDALYAEDLATWRGSLAYVRKRLMSEPVALDAAFADSQRKRAAAAEAARKAAERREDFTSMFVFDSSVEDLPGWRLGARLLSTLDEREVMKMAHRERAVWAENPNPMQRSLPVGASSALQAYRDELSIFKPGVKVARVKLILERWEDGGAFSAGVEAFGPGGEKVDAQNIRMANDTEILKKPGGHTFVAPKPLESEHVIVLPEEAQEQLDAMTARSPRAQILMPKWKPILCSPTKYEPLRLLMGTEFVTAAQDSGANLVGTPDEQSFLRYRSTKSNLTPSQFFDSEKTSVHREDDGWMIVRPLRPVERLSRPAGELILKRAVAAGGLSLDDAATWAGQDPYEFPFIDWLGNALGVIFPSFGRYSVLSTVNDETGLRLWDSLGGARTALRNGATLRITSLPAAAQERIAEQVYWYEGFGEADPTELFPNGLQDGMVSMSVKETPVFSSWKSSQSEPTAPYVYDATSFGKALAKDSSNGQPEPGNRRFRMGIFRTYTLHFKLMPGEKTFDLELSELFLDLADPRDRLPDSILTQVEDSRKTALSKPPVKGNDDVPPPM